MIEQLIARVFQTRNLAQIEHWNVAGPGSYAKHMALGAFYGALIDELDSIVEAHIGLTGPVKKLPPAPRYTPDDEDDDAFLDYLEDEAEWIEENRDEIAAGVSAIENMVDTLTGVYLAAIYKLKRLA